MAGIRTTGAAWSQVQRLFGLGTVSGLTEWQLLERYAARRDEAAFAALVARHGAMVLGVCRRVLRDPEDVEDAFQATFLVLVRKAGSLRPRDPVGHWLYGVACRVALRARSDAARRRSRERPAGDVEVVDDGRAPDPDLGPFLDEELKRLPASYRSAVVLCYLEGLTHEEAARQLGWPLGTVKGRLNRARGLLRDRLSRRGLSLTTTGLAAALSGEAGASVPSGWAETVVKAAACVAAGEATAGVVTPSAVALAEGVIWAMFLNHWKSGLAALAVVAAVTAGAGALAQKDGTGKPDAAVVARDGPRGGAASDAKPADRIDVEAKATVDPSRESGKTADEPSPSRLVSDARSAYELAAQSYHMGRLDVETVHRWSRRLADVEAEADGPRKAAEGHLKRMKDLEQLTQVRSETGVDSFPESVPPLTRLNARFYRQEAERLVKSAEGERTPPRRAVTSSGVLLQADELEVHGRGAVTISTPIPAGGGGAGPADERPSKDPRSLAVVKALDVTLAMNFEKDTPLEDVLKYVKEKTKSADFPKGLPVYVDPQGLQEAEKTMTSPVTIDLDGVPLRRTLHLALRQLGLVYKVDDGMIYITSESSEDAGPLPSAVQEPSPFVVMQGRHERGEMSPEERKAFIELLKDRREIEQLLADPRHPRAGTGGGLQ